MAHLQDRIGPKVTKLYPNQSWIRPGADLQSPSKNTVNRSKSRQTDEQYDSDASSREGEVSSSQTLLKRIRPDHRSSPSRPTQPLSLLSRMGYVSEGEDVGSIQQPSLSAQVGSTKDTHRSSYSSGSTGRAMTRVMDSNHDITNSKHPQRGSPQPSLPSLSNGQENALIAKHQPPGSVSSLKHPDSDQTKYNDDLVVKPLTKEASSLESFHKSILHDSSKSNFPPSNGEASQTRLADNLATSKKITLPNLSLSREQEAEEGELAINKNIITPPTFPRSQEQEAEEGELADPTSEQVRDLLLPLMMKNAAHRVKDGDSGLSRHIAHNVLSEEVCASFMDQMKEVCTEMHAHRSSHNPPQIQLTEANKPYAPPSSKIGQQPPSGPRAMTMSYPIKIDTYIPPNGEIATKTSPSNDVSQPVSAVSNHSHHYPVSSPTHEWREADFRRTSSPERDHDQSRRYSPHREPRLDDHHSHSRSYSSNRHSLGQPYYRQSDPSRERARSRSPVTLATAPRPRPRSPLPYRRRPSPAGASQSRYFRDRSFRESPETMTLGRRSGSPSGSSSHDRTSERRQSLSHSFWRIEGELSPRWDTTDSPQTPVYPFSRSHFDRRDADEVSSPRSPSFTRDRGPVLDGPPRRRRDSHVSIAHSGTGFARHPASPPRRQYHRQASVERPLPHTSRRDTPQPPTPNLYCQSPREQASFEQSPRETGAYIHMESPSPGGGSISRRHLIDNVAVHHYIEKPMVIDNEDMQGRVNEEVGMRLPKRSGDMLELGQTVLPCHNVPGVWFVKVALGNIGTLECSFEVDEITALKWNLQHNNVHTLQKERLQLQICCLSQKLVQSVMGSLKPDATAQDVTNAMLTIENDWPTPGHLIIVVNPQVKNKRIWLPNKLEPPYLPVCIEDCVFQGQNTVQFIQLSAMSERMFVLFATSRPILDELQHVDHEKLGLAPLQNTIDGGKGDVFDIGLGKVTISDLR